MAFLVDFTQTTAADISPRLILVDGPPGDIYVALLSAVRSNGIRYCGGALTGEDCFRVEAPPDSVVSRMPVPPDHTVYVYWKVELGQRYVGYSSVVHWNEPDHRFRAFDFTVWVLLTHPSIASNAGSEGIEARVTVNACWMDHIVNPAGEPRSSSNSRVPSQPSPMLRYPFEPDRPQE